MKAFPIWTDEAIFQHGMDLRDYFAAKAMISLVHIFSDDQTIDNPDKRRLVVAKAAYLQADAMMEARKNES